MANISAQQLTLGATNGGVEADGRDLRIASAFFGDGLSGGGGSVAAVDLHGTDPCLEFDGGKLRLVSTLTKDIAMESGNFISGNAPTDDAHFATKAYADAIATGLSDFKNSCQVASTGNLTLSGEQTIDGVLTSASRILVKDQSTGSENGIYVTAAGAWARASDFDASAEVTAGAYVFVDQGTANADTAFVLATNDPITLGTTALTFTKFSGAGQITAGAGISKSGNTLSADTDGTTIETTATDSGVLQVVSGGIDTTQLADASVTTAKLDADAVTSDEIADGAIDTAAQIANDLIDSQHYAPDSIDAEHYAPGSVDATALAAAVAGAGMTGGGGSALAIVSGNGGIVVNADDVTLTLDGGTLSVGASGVKVADLGVDTGQLAADSVTSAKIADGAIDTAAQIANDLIDSQHLAAGGIDEEHLSLEVQGRLAHNALDDTTSTPTLNASVTDGGYGDSAGWIDGSGNQGLVEELATPDANCRVQLGGTAYNHRGELVTVGTTASLGGFTSVSASTERYDLIVADSAGTITRRAGTASGIGLAVYPDGSAGDVVLAAVYVDETGSVTINEADITDLRSRKPIDGRKIKAGSVGGSNGSLSAGVIELSSITDADLALVPSREQYTSADDDGRVFNLLFSPTAGWEPFFVVARNGVVCSYANQDTPTADGNEYDFSGATLRMGAALVANDLVEVRYIHTGLLP
jgi:hypothetical protein